MSFGTCCCLGSQCYEPLNKRKWFLALPEYLGKIPRLPNACNVLATLKTKTTNEVDVEHLNTLYVSR